MSGVPRCDRFNDLKEAYALGTLSEDDRQEFEDLLAAHPELQTEVAAFESTANLLARASQEQDPPPELRRNPLGGIGANEDTFMADAAAPAESAAHRARRPFGPLGYAASTPAAVAALAISDCSFGTLLYAERTRICAVRCRTARFRSCKVRERRVTFEER